MKASATRAVPDSFWMLRIRARAAGARSHWRQLGGLDHEGSMRRSRRKMTSWAMIK